MEKKKIVIAVTGASGAIYASVLIEKLVQIQDQIQEVALVFSDNAKDVWEYELENTDWKDLPFKTYDRMDFFAPFASGSARFDTMIICPCSMGTMSRIATGISSDLITRGADVILKERRKLILVPRDAPYGLIQLKNMTLLSEAGAIICPASPSFYSRPKDFRELAATVTDRVLDLAGFELNTFRWGNKS